MLAGQPRRLWALVGHVTRSVTTNGRPIAQERKADSLRPVQRVVDPLEDQRRIADGEAAPPTCQDRYLLIGLFRALGGGRTRTWTWFATLSVWRNSRRTRVGWLAGCSRG